MTTIKAVILDIEGTTTPISFVADVMFPFVRKNLESYLNEHWGDEELNNDIDALRSLAESDVNEGMDVSLIPPLDEGKETVIDAIMKNVFQQMDSDRKTTALKQLQGHIWKNGFESGSLVGMYVYSDDCCYISIV